MAFSLNIVAADISSQFSHSLTVFFFVCIGVCVKAACQNAPLGTNKRTLTLVLQ